MLEQLKSALAVAALAAGLFVTAGRAEDKKPDDKKPDDKKELAKVTAEGKAALDLAAALRMADFGRENKAPEALLAAARVIGRTNAKALEAKGGKKGEQEEFDPLKEANALIEAAIEVSGKDESVKKLAAAVRDDVKEFKRGATGGPRAVSGFVGRGDRRDEYTIRFRGGERAVVRVNNRSNRGDLDLTVIDEDGRVVAHDHHEDDDAFVSFFVRRTQSYTVIVHARCTGNDRPLRYTLTTN